MDKVKYNELIKDAIWEIKRGNHKISTIENEDYILLLSSFNENIILRYFLYKVKKSIWKDSDEELEIVSLQKQVISREPIIVKDGRVTVNGITFIMEKRQRFDVELYTRDEAQNDIEYLKTVLDSDDEKIKRDAENIINNLNEYIAYYDSEKVSLENMKFYKE